MRLNGSQFEKLSEALIQAFSTPEEFERMVRFKLGENIHEIGYGDLQNQVFRLIRWADSRDRIIELVLGAHQFNPSNLKLLSIAQDFGLAIEAPSPRELQRIIKASNGFLDVNGWRVKLALIEYQVCRIEIELNNHQRVFGTGFLIGTDVVITNYHVMKYVIEHKQRQNSGKRWASPKDIVLCFDYKVLPEQGYENPGTLFRLNSKEWMIDVSPMSIYDNVPYDETNLPEVDQLDYALLRVDGSPGDQTIGESPSDQTIGESEPGGPKRGWIKLQEEKLDFPPESAVIIVQHPRAEPLKLAIETSGIVGLNANSTRVMYRTNTERGSSGSPCFNIDWELIALHHSGDPDFSIGHQPTYNQGIPFSAIRDLWQKRDLLDEINN